MFLLLVKIVLQALFSEHLQNVQHGISFRRHGQILALAHFKQEHETGKSSGNSWHSVSGKN